MSQHHHHHHHGHHEDERGFEAEEALGRLRLNEDRYHYLDEPHRGHHTSSLEYEEYPHYRHGGHDKIPLEYEERPRHHHDYQGSPSVEYVELPHHREGHHERLPPEYEYVPRHHNDRQNRSSPEYENEPRHHNGHGRRPPEHDDDSIDHSGRHSRSSPEPEDDPRKKNGYNGGQPPGYQNSPLQNDVSLASLATFLPFGDQNKPPHGYGPPPPSRFQNGPPLGYQPAPPQIGYQNGPPQGNGPPPPPPMGYQNGPPPQMGYQNGPPQGSGPPPPTGYQNGPPQGNGPPPSSLGYQNGPPQGNGPPPPMGYQNGPPPNYAQPDMFHVQGNQNGRPQGYGTPPPPFFQNSPSQGYGPPPPALGYQGGPNLAYGGPPQHFQAAPPANNPLGPPTNYQNVQPIGYQQGPPFGFTGGQQSYQQSAQGYQGGPPQGFHRGPPQEYQHGPPPGFQSNIPEGGRYQSGAGPSTVSVPSGPGPQQPHMNQQNSQAPGGYIGGPPQQAQHPYTSNQRPLRRKSLLVGINYIGSQHTLRGCQQDVSNMMEFLRFKGYSSDPRSQVVMRDDAHTDPRGPYWPTGKNILAAMHWLVSEPNTCNFLHYSGHGSQVEDPEDEHESGYEDTIVPVDFEVNGQIESERLHRTLVSALAPNSTLFIIFDCCHSGSAVELPFVYRSDEDGKVSIIDNLRAGVGLIEGASSLVAGGFTMDKLVQARSLFAGANTFFKQLQHSDEEQEEGVGEVTFGEDWSAEHKFVTMYSGCRDDQTSADAVIGGASVGAMSWAFLETMRRNPHPTYLNTLQQTRGILGQSHYKQIPQLSIGFKDLDLNQPLRF